MEDEKLLPPGEPAPQAPTPSYFHLQNKLAPSSPARTSAPVLPAEPAPGIPKFIPPPPIAPAPGIPKFMPPPPSLARENPPEERLPGMPTPSQQQWGVVISIVIIVLMIVVGAFYSWGKRIAQEQALYLQSVAQ